MKAFGSYAWARLVREKPVSCGWLSTPQSYAGTHSLRSSMTLRTYGLSTHVPCKYEASKNFSVEVFDKEKYRQSRSEATHVTTLKYQRKTWPRSVSGWRARVARSTVNGRRCPTSVSLRSSRKRHREDVKNSSLPLSSNSSSRAEKWASVLWVPPNRPPMFRLTFYDKRRQLRSFVLLVLMSTTWESVCTLIRRS